MLQEDFVVGWKNNEREDYCGTSRGYARTQTALGTTNGAGGHNVQIFVLSPDLVVLHALPGFWHPEDLVAELQFAKVLDQLWRDDGRTRAQKETMWKRLHRTELRRQSEATTARSDWQSFDRSMELSRARDEVRDTIVVGAAGLQVKPINQLVHERLIRRPFVKFEDFDTADFVDYGKTHYDNNSGFDETSGRFATAERLQTKRARQQAREEKLAALRARR